MVFDECLSNEDENLTIAQPTFPPISTSRNRKQLESPAKEYHLEIFCKNCPTLVNLKRILGLLF